MIKMAEDKKKVVKKTTPKATKKTKKTSKKTTKKKVSKKVTTPKVDVETEEDVKAKELAKVEAYKKNKLKIIFFKPNKLVQEIFEQTNLTKIIKVCNSEKELPVGMQKTKKRKKTS